MVSRLRALTHIKNVARQEGSILLLRAFSAESSALQKQLEEAAKERDEVRRQMSQLLQQSEALASQVELLTKTITSQSNQDLMQIQGLKSEEWPKRAKFKPLRHEILDQPTHVSQLSNRPLYELAMAGNHSANKERLIREIMQVDDVTWEEAHRSLDELDAYNERYYWGETMPYRIAIMVATVSAVAGSAMVFYPPVAEVYGVNVAGEELPEGVKDISEMTINQVGTWTWGWMEPMIGTASFVILCSQVCRAQMWKLNMRPYTEQMLRSRANRLAKNYPEYDSGIVRAWAKHMPMVNSFMMPNYRRNLGWKRI